MKRFVAFDADVLPLTPIVRRGTSIRSEMRWPRGGRSLSFNDPDGHVIELATPGLWEND